MKVPVFQRAHITAWLLTSMTEVHIVTPANMTETVLLNNIYAYVQPQIQIHKCY